jgi:hypothetical protein
MNTATSGSFLEMQLPCLTPTYRIRRCTGAFPQAIHVHVELRTVAPSHLDSVKYKDIGIPGKVF